jgi:hypothetical protein
MAGTIVANTINTDTGIYSTNNAYSGIAKAWVNFTGSGGVINKSFNVSSITVNSTGVYTINFATAMSDTNYATFVSIMDAGTGNREYGMTFNGGTYTTSAVQIETLDGTTPNTNPRNFVVVYD